MRGSWGYPAKSDVDYEWYLSQVIVKSAPVSARNALHISFGSELFALSLVSFGGLG